MKNLLLPSLACLCVFACRSLPRPIFPEEARFLENNRKYREHPTVNPVPIFKSDQGAYNLNICMGDTTILDERVRWFCDCPRTGAKVEETITMLFIDDVHMVYYRNFRIEDTHLDLEKLPRKYVKIGVYEQKPSPLAPGESKLTVILQKPVVKDTLDPPVTMIFNMRDQVLELDSIYFRKKPSGISRDDSSIETMRRKIRDIMPLKHIWYIFSPTPFTLN
jgi:hypothetical protein